MVNLPIVQVGEPPEGQACRVIMDDGIAITSARPEISRNGLPTPEAKRKSRLADPKIRPQEHQLQTPRLGSSAASGMGEPFPSFGNRRRWPPVSTKLARIRLPLLPPPT